MLSLQRQPGGQRLTALALTAVFTLGFGSTFLHVDNASHTYCEQHQRITHQADHDHRADTEQSRTLFQSNPTHGDDTPEDHEPSGCQWLTWLHMNTSPLADLHPQLLDLPPPAEPEVASIPKRHQFAGHPIARRHVSPINSPPTG